MTQIKPKIKDEPKQFTNSMQILEEALFVCQFGKFQILLMTICFIAGIASAMVVTTSSYVLSIAECDLNIDIVEKGVLNAMPFVGQIGISVFAGFMADAFGRRICILTGFIGVFFSTLLQGSSQAFWMLLLGKLLDGIFSGLCFNAMSVLIPEFTHNKVRDRAMMVSGAFLSLALVIAALYSWAVLPHSWYFSFWGGSFELHTWNLYLYGSSIWSLVAVIAFYYLPETPKYLLSQGQENDALEVLKTIYSINTGLPKETFPIKYLNVDGVEKPIDIHISMKTQLVNGLKGLKPLLRKPLLKYLVLLTAMAFISMMAYSTLRLWLPQLTTVIENYELVHNGTERFCVMINEYTDSLVSKVPVGDDLDPQVCIPQLSGRDTYINGIIFGMVSMLSVVVASIFIGLVNIKIMMFTLFMVCAGGTSFLYWTKSSLEMAILLSTTCSFMLTASGFKQIILVRVFPTNLRALTMSLMVTIGRIGSLIGNILFPVLLQANCMSPFLTIALFNLVLACFVFFLPNPEKINSDTGDK